MPTSQCRICTKRCREFKIQVTPQLTPARQRRLPTCSKAFRIIYGGEWGPVTFPAFKAGDSSLRGWNGGFDFHTPPPYPASIQLFNFTQGNTREHYIRRSVPVGSKRRTTFLFAFRSRSGTAVV